MNKRATINLSMNFIVVLIISLVIFSFGVSFVYTIINNANSLKDMTIEDIDSKITDLMCKSTQKVCIERELVVLPPGEVEIIGVRILNIDDTGPEREFKIEMSPGIFQYPNGTSMGYHPTPIYVNPGSRLEKIKQNEMKEMGFGFEINKEALKGTYVFNLNITNYPLSDKYDKLHKMRIKVT